VPIDRFTARAMRSVARLVDAAPQRRDIGSRPPGGRRSSVSAATGPSRGCVPGG